MADSSSSEADTKKSKPNMGNGGNGPNYTWTQILSEVTITIPVPPETTPKQINCDISDVKVKCTLANGTTLVDGKFHAKIREDESYWQLDRAEGVITLHIEKIDKLNWWSCAIEGHEQIDVSVVEPDNSRLDDLDTETRGMVEKMMYDQRQKAAGLPTSDEQDKMKLFEKFKREHPEMDFSNAKFQ